MPCFIALFSVGHSADGSVPDTSSASAPLVMAAWMAGICEAGVAAVPLVSVPVSPSACSAAIAPPDFALSEVVKYGLPRFFGMTKTLSPVFSAPEPPAAGELDAVPDGVPDEPQAASTADTATSTAGSQSLRLGGALIAESFQSEREKNGACVSGSGRAGRAGCYPVPCYRDCSAGQSWRAPAPGAAAAGDRRSDARSRPASDAAF